MRIVLDTNVVVSAVLSPYGAPSSVLRLVLQGDLTLLIDNRIVSEYRDVLRRPVFALDPADVNALVEGIEHAGELVLAAPAAVDLPDPDDLPFLEVAISGRCDALVTGNVRHFRSLRGTHSVNVVTPRTFLDSLRY